MKRRLPAAVFVMCWMLLPIQKVSAQIPIAEVIKAAVVKVIKAIDLKVQRLQNKTIWLQNAQKTLENKMSEWKLSEIREWVEKQRKLYDDYFQELWQVKAALAKYQQVKDIIAKQVQLVTEYKGAWGLFGQDKNFTPEELAYMQSIYSGMLDESLKNMDGLFLVVNAFATQMSDAKRLEMIHRVNNAIDQQLTDLRQFNNQNRMLSLQRSAERGEIDYVRRLHGITR